jgi:aminopeptidase N
MWVSHYFSIKWWEDSFLLESINIFTTHLFFKETNSNQNSTHITDLIFDNFKTKAIVADKSSDHHPVWLQINDSNDARILFDEITCFKGASLFNYFYSLIGENFWNKLEKFLNSSRANERLLFCELFFKYFENIETTENKYIPCTSKNTKIESAADELKFFFKNSKVSRLRCVI